MIRVGSSEFVGPPPCEQSSPTASTIGTGSVGSTSGSTVGPRSGGSTNASTIGPRSVGSTQPEDRTSQTSASSEEQRSIEALKTILQRQGIETNDIGVSG